MRWAVPTAGGRSLPNTPEEWVSLSIGLACFLGILAVSMFCFIRFMSGWRKAYESRLLRESEEFRSSWPTERLAKAPYLELQREAERCWQLALLIEERTALSGDRDALGKLAATRSRAVALAGALNNASSNGQR